VDLGGFVHELPSERWQRVMNINLNGAFYASKLVLRALIDAQLPGSIVLCSSPAAFVGFAAGANSAYAASKGGISALTRTLAVDYARHGIRVNAIVPGPTETPLMWMAVPEAERPATREQITEEVPIGRMADPAEPAQAAVWLLSDDSSYVIGSHLVCDGGVLAKASVSV
jgi:NAD(P)-dependent dehydrogenase (short-subunit alcohol dehydrogenase family)